VAHGAAVPERLPVPGRRIVHRDAGITSTLADLARAPQPDDRGRLTRTPLAALADALGTHLDLFQRIVVSPCSVSAIWYATTGPVVLTSNSTGDDLTTLGLS
jgi:hypothetical protein